MFFSHTHVISLEPYIFAPLHTHKHGYIYKSFSMCMVCVPLYSTYFTASEFEVILKSISGKKATKIPHAHVRCVSAAQNKRSVAPPPRAVGLC